MSNHSKNPILPVPRPVCPECGEEVTAMLCGTSPRTAEAVTALQDLLLAVHRKLAHEKRPPDDRWATPAHNVHLDAGLCPYVDPSGTWCNGGIAHAGEHYARRANSNGTSSWVWLVGGHMVGRAS